MIDIFVIGITLYFIAMLLIGYFASKRIKTLEDYFVAGRNLPLTLAVPTIIATWFGAGSSMGVSGTVYSEGFYGVIADPFGCSLALLLGGIFFAAPFRKLHLLTISDLLHNAYGPIFSKVSTLAVLPFYIGTLASQMVAMGYVFQIISGIDFHLGVVLGAAVILCYTLIGGMWAVSLTDFIQLLLLIIGLGLIFHVCWQEVPDCSITLEKFTREFSSLVPKNKSVIDIFSYIGSILMTGLGAIMGQDLIQRFLSSRSEKTARWSGIGGAVGYLLLGLIPLFIGIAGREIYSSLEKPELLIPLLAKDYLSPIAFTIFACGLLAAIMSTADSYLLAGSSLMFNNLLVDFTHKFDVRSKLGIVRYANLGITLLALGLAFTGQSIFGLMVHSGATLFVGIFVPVCMALFWKNANVYSAWVSLISGHLGWFLCLSSSLIWSDHPLDTILFCSATIGASTSLVSYFLVALFIQRSKSPKLIYN